jgi:error-prone DNA polymerase
MSGSSDSGSGYVELHAHSAFSFLRAGSAVEALVARAAELGMPALALTDTMTLASVVRFQAACAAHGIQPILGCEVAVADPIFGDIAAPARLVVLAEDAVGYARLCQLLTDANLADPARPIVPFAALTEQARGLIVLTGAREGALARLLLAGRRRAAVQVAARYRDAFGTAHVYVELQHHRLPDSTWLLQELAQVAAETGLRGVATNGVRHATREDHPVYDLLTCVRLGITVDTPHAERPRNAEGHLKSGAEVAALFAPFPWGAEALAATNEIAARCDLSLLRGACTAPRVPLPAGATPATQLHTLCEEGLAVRYAAAPEALLPDSPQRRQLVHELEVIERLDLAEFFLCVHHIMAAARAMGIRVSGRGSAANSLAAYLLHITGVDPLAHNLLFERFLNPERRGMPDIDVDVQSDRRDELIRWVERTFTEQHAAMVANVHTYRTRGALRDAAKALGFPLELVNTLTKVLPHHAGRRALPGYRDELAQVIRTELVRDAATLRAQCLERLPLLLDLAPRLVGLPRHLSLHNGGMVLSRAPLAQLLPVRISANGTRALEVDKDDVEWLGLIKFDLLGLRTLGAVEEALTLIEETTGTRPDVDHLPTDPPDAATMRLVRAGQTLAVFQIESPGQWHLLAQTQPRTFNDLIVQTALFRPGPIQGGFVHPYIARRRAKQADAVQTPWPRGQAPDPFWVEHPVLGPILAETEGILLFQEQILTIAHAFAGLSYAEADGFRRAMSHARDPEEMAALRAQFVGGALARSETVEAVTRVFEAISHFVGYGFCKSHAAEFARTIYSTTWLKAHYPAHYLAAFLTAQPAGFFPPHVVLEEARLLGIPVLPPDVNRSEARFSVERVGMSPYRPMGRWAIRIGLRQVAHVGDELADAILWERRQEQLAGAREQPFASLADFCARLRPAGLTWQAVEALVLSGACDGLPPHMDRRRRLWQLHEVWPLAVTSHGTRMRRTRRGGRHRESTAEQLALDWSLASDAPNDAPSLPALTAEERAALDFQFLGMSARPHPMRLMRRELRRTGIRPIAEVAEMPEGRVIRVAGWAISAQRPPTAKGMAFLVLEDESGRLPVALPPHLAEQMHRVIRSARVVAVAGHVERVRWYRSLLGFDLHAVA